MIRWLRKLVRKRERDLIPDRKLIAEVERRQRLVEWELRQLEIRRGRRT
jgi:hypothetical protein